MDATPEHPEPEPVPGATPAEPPAAVPASGDRPIPPAWATAPWPDEPPGRALGLVDWVATLAFAVLTVVAAIVLGPVRYVAVAVSLAMFAIGVVAFLWAYATAIQRSRYDEIGIGGLFFLAGPTAPAVVRRSLNLALATQVVAGLGGAIARPFTTLAFGILAPMLGLGLNGLWGSRHGRFGPRRRRDDGPSDPPPADHIDQNADHG